MSNYYQLITPNQKTETWSFEDAGSASYNKYIIEGVSNENTQEGWHILNNHPNEDWYLTEEEVQELGAQSMTASDFNAYFIPGNRPGTKPRP